MQNVTALPAEGTPHRPNSRRSLLLFTAVWKLQQNLQSKYLFCSLHGEAGGQFRVEQNDRHAWTSAWQAARCPPPPIMSDQINLKHCQGAERGKPQYVPHVSTIFALAKPLFSPELVAAGKSFWLSSQSADAFSLESAFSAELKHAVCLRSMKTLHAQEFPEWAFFPSELFSYGNWKIWPIPEDGADLSCTVRPA